MIDAFLPWLVDGLVLTGLFVTSVSIFGLYRMPDIYTHLHAASKAVVLGVVPILLSIAVLGDIAMTVRAILIGIFILLTTPVSAHAIGRAAFLRREPMKGPDALDESGELAHEPVLNGDVDDVDDIDVKGKNRGSF